MRSPLSPILADIVMQDLEEKAIMNIDIDFPFYYRYVDDVVLLTPVDKVNTILNTFSGIQRLTFSRHRRVVFGVSLV